MPSLIFKMLIIMRTTILILLWWPIGSKFSFHNVKPHQCQTSSNLSSPAGWKTGQIKFVHGVFDHFEIGGFGLLIVKLRDIFFSDNLPFTNCLANCSTSLTQISTNNSAAHNSSTETKRNVNSIWFCHTQIFLYLSSNQQSYGIYKSLVCISSLSYWS